MTCISLIISNPTGILNFFPYSFFGHIFFWKLVEIVWTLSQHKLFNYIKENAQFYKGNQLNPNTVIKIVRIQNCDISNVCASLSMYDIFHPGLSSLEDFQRVTECSLLNLNQGQSHS